MSTVKRRGRPRIDEHDESVNVNVRLPSRRYDALYAKAQRERVTIPEIIRRSIQRDDDPPKK